MKTVLVVEDSRAQRQLITQFLQTHAFQVMTAQNGLEALQQVEQYLPDLVILDIVMPGMSGYEVCRRLKANPDTRNIPVIFCSSNATDVDRYWGGKQGASAHLGKPFQPQELVNVINQVLTVQPLSGY